MKPFEPINRGFNSTFKQGQLSIGVVVPIENYPQSPVPTMKDHLKRVQLIEQLGFKALWLRDIPFNVPNFGDAGQMYDPFTYLGYLAAKTSNIALGIASIALPLHHPANVAKAAASVDQLSEGRLIMGVASGDRLSEYPAMGLDFEKRGQLFREAFTYIRKAQESFPTIESSTYGTLNGRMDILPKATSHKIPMLMTGYSRQSLEWNAQNADGWMNYPRNLYQQLHNIKKWRQLIAESQQYDKPFMQPLYVALEPNHDYKPTPIHLGFRIGTNYLIDYLRQLKSIGVNHLAINLRFNNMNMEQTLEQIAKNVLPHFHLNNQ